MEKVSHFEQAMGLSAEFLHFASVYVGTHVCVIDTGKTLVLDHCLLMLSRLLGWTLDTLLLQVPITRMKFLADASAPVAAN